LVHYITHADLNDFQPMKAIFGILPELERPARTRRERAMQYAERGKQAFHAWAESHALHSVVKEEQ
jgi:methylenetetrahydrofolate--tRNA-(uracil-5-)-methyltransferase